MAGQNKDNGLSVFLGLLAMYGAVFGARGLWDRWSGEIRLETGKADYFHHEFVDIRLKTRDPALTARWEASPPRVAVLRGGARVTTIASMKEVILEYDAAGAQWAGRWPCPWNAPAGEYELELLDSLAPETRARLQKRPFRIVHRRPHPLPKGFAVLTL